MRKIADPVLVVDAAGVQLVTAGVGSKTSVFFQSPQRNLVVAAHHAAETGAEVELRPGAPTVKAGYETELQILAALLSVKPGRVQIVQASQTVLDEVDEIVGKVDPKSLY